MCVWGEMTPIDTIGYQIKAQGQAWIISFWVVGHWGPMDFQLLETIPITLDYSSEFASKPPLFKMLYTWVTEPGEIKLLLMRKLHPCGLVFINWVMLHMLLEEKGIINLTQLWTPWAPIASGLARYSNWYNRCTNVMVWHNDFLMGFKAFSTRWNSPGSVTNWSKAHGWLVHRCWGRTYHY